jgi:hypothetical protein
MCKNVIQPYYNAGQKLLKQIPYFYCFSYNHFSLRLAIRGDKICAYKYYLEFRGQYFMYSTFVREYVRACTHKRTHAGTQLEKEGKTISRDDKQKFTIPIYCY